MKSTEDNDRSLRERATERADVRSELAKLEQKIEELKVDYEQYFLGFFPYAPDKAHNELKQMIRRLFKMPFKNSEMSYRLRMLETRYRTYNTYWERTKKQRENGTYSRDVFKANIREKNALEDARAGTKVGKAANNMQSLYNSYKQELEKQTGKKQNLDYKAFQRSLVKQAKAFQKQHGDKKVSFKVVVKEGKVALQAKAKKG